MRQESSDANKIMCLANFEVSEFLVADNIKTDGFLLRLTVKNLLVRRTYQGGLPKNEQDVWDRVWR